MSRLRPLGVREEVGLDEGQLRAIAALEAYDLGPVRARLLASGTMPPDWVDEAILEFRRYLALRLVTSEPPVMLSRQVDEVWHTLLIFTRMYADFCATTFGYFIHHDPNLEPDPDLTDDDWDHFEKTYRHVFGKPGPLWLLWRPFE